MQTSLARAARNGAWNREVSRTLSAPLMQGLMAFAHGRYDAAAQAIHPLRPILAPFGGSHAQRDVIDQTLLAAAARGGMADAGRSLLAERARAKPGSPLTGWWRRHIPAASRPGQGPSATG